MKRTVFYELLKRVRDETKKQSDILLKKEIETIKKEKSNEWEMLIGYNVKTKHSHNARQDLCGCLQAQYTENDLSESLYPPSTHFSAKLHYDSNIYLNQLMFNGNILNDMFQKDMMKITKAINQETGDAVTFRMGSFYLSFILIVYLYKKNTLIKDRLKQFLRVKRRYKTIISMKIIQSPQKFLI